LDYNCTSAAWSASAAGDSAAARWLLHAVGLHGHRSLRCVLCSKTIHFQETTATTANEPLIDRDDQRLAIALLKSQT
jgi:hypothetical protein